MTEKGKGDYHKIYQTGSSRTLVVTKYVPIAWRVVKVTCVERAWDSVWLKIEKID